MNTQTQTQPTAMEKLPPRREVDRQLRSFAHTPGRLTAAQQKAIVAYAFAQASLSEFRNETRTIRQMIRRGEANAVLYKQALKFRIEAINKAIKQLKEAGVIN